MDEDNWENLDAEEDSKNEEEDSEPEKKTPNEPTSNDYMAGAILANGVIWFWILSLQMFANRLSGINPSLLADMTFVTVVVAGFVSSQQVAKRSDRNQLIVALKSALYSWAGSLLMLATTPNVSISPITFLLCLIAGGVLGSYMLIRMRINERKKRLQASS